MCPPRTLHGKEAGATPLRVVTACRVAQTEAAGEEAAGEARCQAPSRHLCCAHAVHSGQCLCSGAPPALRSQRLSAAAGPTHAGGYPCAFPLLSGISYTWWGSGGTPAGTPQWQWRSV